MLGIVNNSKSIAQAMVDAAMKVVIIIYLENSEFLNTE